MRFPGLPDFPDPRFKRDLVRRRLIEIMGVATAAGDHQSPGLWWWDLLFWARPHISQLKNWEYWLCNFPGPAHDALKFRLGLG